LGPDAVLTPAEVSSRVLRRLLDSAEAFTGGDKITRAVITVPAYFDDAQCAATIAAGELSGLEKVKTLREPIAAALAYGVGASLNPDRVPRDPFRRRSRALDPRSTNRAPMHY
jgi:molecular chaperone DnaK (HSP70)